MSRLFTANSIKVPPVSEIVHVGLQVNGPGGGQCKLRVCDGRILAAEDGISKYCGVVFHLTSDTFHRLAAGQMSISKAVKQGQITTKGNGIQTPVVEALLQTIVIPDDA
ncbi:MAG: SCP2 sterol-binding domain-containing protein [Planctomycetota bacterium]|jgi:hypothetical protein